MRKRERERVYLVVRERERERELFQFERERERERESVCFWERRGTEGLMIERQELVETEEGTWVVGPIFTHHSSL